MPTLKKIISEKRIRDLQQQARKNILNAKSRWRSEIDLNLRYYTIRNENEIINKYLIRKPTNTQ